MAELKMFPSGEDKKQFKIRQALHDEQLRIEQIQREAKYDPKLTPEEFAAKRAEDIAAAEARDAEAIASSPNYIEQE